jgi:peptide/nickel transport system substrate-binding protein
MKRASTFLIVAALIAGIVACGPVPTPRTGAWLDEVIIMEEPDAAQAILELQSDRLDVYASYGLADVSLHAEVLADPSLRLMESSRNCNEFTFNPVGPTFLGTGKLNPFSIPEFREAMHWLVDRNYIAEEIWGGLAVPRYTCLAAEFPDAAERFPDMIEEIEANYAHDAIKAEAAIIEEMKKLGAVFEEDRWVYDDEPVEIIGLIRTEDKLRDIGDYLAALLEGLGFTVSKRYGTGAELNPLWFYGDPALGMWHFYTGGWVHHVGPRDEGRNFGYFYTDLYYDVLPLYQAYENDPIFYGATERLWNNNYTSMEERAGLFEICLSMSMEDNVRMFLVENKWFTPMREDVRMVADLAGGVLTSSMWAYTAHFRDAEGPTSGGTLRVAVPSVLTEPWNPMTDLGWSHDFIGSIATSDQGLHIDTRDWLFWPGRIERAEVYVRQGLPISITHDWLTLESVPEIVVPQDAWADWNATSQEFITVGQKTDPGSPYYDADYSPGALRKSVVYYPEDIFETPLHDGSTLSVGDFIMGMIVLLDRGKKDSPIYDPDQEASVEAFLSTFKGVRIVSAESNLMIETYSDLWCLDAEWNVTTWFPTYGTYDLESYAWTGQPGFWHTIAVGWLAEESMELAFSSEKAATLGVKRTDYTKGSSLPLLKKWMDWAAAENYIPYAPTLADYITADEAAERWANLRNWYADQGHFWVGSGPFYLEAVDPVVKTIHLKRFDDYPDSADKWLFLLEPLP